MNLKLASGSPRRKELLEYLGIPFEVVVANIDERPVEGEHTAEMVCRLAKEKAQAVQACGEESCIIAADTVVVRDGVVLGKPRCEEEALSMLESLSGRWHEVLTGIAIAVPGRIEVAVGTTEVEFAQVSQTRLRAYVATGEPMDKAGAYGLQGGGMQFVRQIKGSYSNVIGLDLVELCRLFEVVGYGREV